MMNKMLKVCEQRFRKEIRKEATRICFCFSGEDALKVMKTMEHEAVFDLSEY